MIFFRVAQATHPIPALESTQPGPQVDQNGLTIAIQQVCGKEVSPYIFMQNLDRDTC